jgi:hypothetical protein
MSNIWVAIISDIDDGRLLVSGVFDNEMAAQQCVDDDWFAARALVYKLELDKIESTYISYTEE